MDNRSEQHTDNHFVKRVWIAAGILSLVAVVLLLLKATFSVLLLVLAGILIATFFHGLSSMIQKKTKWKTPVTLTISILGTMLLIVGIFWLIGSKLQQQATQLSDQLPQTVENAKAKINSYPVGQKVLDRLSSQKSSSKLRQLAGSFFRSTFGILGDMYVILFLGIFFTVSPQVYTKGIVSLVPARGQPRAKEVLSAVGSSLGKWLKGKLFSMLVVMILTAIGLAIMGIPLWLVLAIIAGLLNFIPNFGPLIAMIPAVLVAFMSGPTTAGLVAGLYILVQALESNLITPAVQKRLVDVPPAMIILAQLIISPLTGAWGLVLATPLMLIVMVVVQELYIKKNL